MAKEFIIDENLIRRLPLPLAQLYRRALNAKTVLERHLASYYLWEASVKLLGSVAVIEYAELRHHDEQLTERLAKLARPALGHWVEFVRRLVPILAEQGDSAFGQLRGGLLGSTGCKDLPCAAGLDAALREMLENKVSPSSTVRLGDLLDRLVHFRNREMGHGAAGQRPRDYYERMSALLLAAAAEVLGRLDVLAGRRLLFIGEVRRQPAGGWLVERFELLGESPRRLEPLEVPETAHRQLPRPECVCLQTPAVGEGPGAFRSLHPLLLYNLDLNEALFLNARRGRQRTEYLSYTTGRFEERQDLGQEQRRLLAQVLGCAVTDQQAETWAAKSQAEEAAVSRPAAPAPATPRRHVGEFELLGELGRGGMGIVYRALQPSLGRQVALKCMLRLGDAKADARFAREIRALGSVEHPHLVKIFTSGAEHDQLFYAMELVEGATLAAICDTLTAGNSGVVDLNLPTWNETLKTVCAETRRAEKRLSGPPRETLQPIAPPPEVKALPRRPPKNLGPDYLCKMVELIRQTAEAAHALHQKGVIHRDIKPGNILVSADDTRAVLMDLGLAQLVNPTEGRLTRTRHFVGTLRYASPEQVLAVGPLDARSDVYSLGATLWELLTLRPLFGADDETPEAELMQRIQYEPAVSLRKYNARLPWRLEAIVMKCLEKDPKRRYGTARELAQDLQHFLADKPIQARPAGRIRRAWQRVKRRPMRALAVLVLPLVLLGGIIAYRTIFPPVGPPPNAWQPAPLPMPNQPAPLPMPNQPEPLLVPKDAGNIALPIFLSNEGAGSATGTIFNATDVRWYSFTAPKTGKMNVELNYPFPSNLDASLYVYDRNNLPLFGVGNDTTRVVFTATWSFTYHVKVASKLFPAPGLFRTGEFNLKFWMDNALEMPNNFSPPQGEKVNGGKFGRRAKVTNAGLVYDLINTNNGAQGLDWPNDEMRRVAGANYWGTWRPVVGDIGDVVAACTHPNTKNRVYIIKIGIYHAPMDEKGVELLPAN